MHHCSPFTAADLDDAALLAADEPALIAKLRWHLHTPYAHVVKAEHEGRLAGFAFGTAHVDSATVQELFVYPTFLELGLSTALATTLLAWMEMQGAPRQSVVALPGAQGFWQRMGFAPQCGLLTYEGGTFDSASRDEVVGVEPHHLLAIARLYEQAFGEDRSHWLREHADLGSVFLEGTRVRGFALPLVGNGLIVAAHPAIGLELQRWLLPVQHSLTLPVGNMAAHQHLIAQKYTAREAGTRMVRGAPMSFRAELVFAHP